VPKLAPREAAEIPRQVAGGSLCHSELFATYIDWQTRETATEAIDVRMPPCQMNRKTSQYPDMAAEEFFEKRESRDFHPHRAHKMWPTLMSFTIIRRVAEFDHDLGPVPPPPASWLLGPVIDE
jgi:hypothetical protein